MSTFLRARTTTILSAACALALAASAGASPELRAAGTARLLPIAGDGYAGSSVNVVAGLQNTLVTEKGVQYAAFYAADATLVLARRDVGSDAWTTVRTGLRGTVADAHNTVAIAVDGAGVLHVAWDHHGGPLNYRRGTAPGSLELGPAEKMTARREDRVTYPSFLRLPDGDLLFLYRDGSSGRGDLVLHRYDVETRRWSPVQARLVDGEGKRSAYASADGRPPGRAAPRVGLARLPGRGDEPRPRLRPLGGRRRDLGDRRRARRCRCPSPRRTRTTRCGFRRAARS